MKRKRRYFVKLVVIEAADDVPVTVRGGAKVVESLTMAAVDNENIALNRTYALEAQAEWLFKWDILEGVPRGK